MSRVDRHEVHYAMECAGHWQSQPVGYVGCSVIKAASHEHVFAFAQEAGPIAMYQA